MRNLVALGLLLSLAPLLLWSCGADPGEECGQCIRAVSCVEACGAEPVQVGCCACPEGSFDDVSCSAGTTGGGCELEECFAAIECVEVCGGPVVSASCCACAAPLVDVSTCPGAGGGGAGGAGAAGGAGGGGGGAGGSGGA